MMVPVSEALKELLCRQGMSAGSGGTGRANGLASAPKSGEEGQTSKRSPTAGRETRPMGMGKRTPAEPAPVNRGKRQQTVGGYNEEPFIWLIADNVDVVPTRQDAIRRTSSLVCIDGGRT